MCSAYAVLTICGADTGDRLLGSNTPWSWRTWLGLPVIPVLLVLSRTSILDNLLPTLPFLFFGPQHIKLNVWPPSMELVLTLLPCARLLYRIFWRWKLEGLERAWDQELAPYASNRSTTGNAAPVLNTGEEAAAAAAEDALIREATEEIDDSYRGRLRERRDIARSIIGALLLPAISSFCGSLLGQWSYLRRRLKEPFHLNILGGCLFILFKDFYQLFYKYQRVKQYRSRRIRAFPL